jgi:hypothetical protein
MNRPPAFSVAVLFSDVLLADAIAAFDRISADRGLAENEPPQLAAYQALQAEALLLRSASWSMYAHHRTRTTAPFREQLKRCAASTAAGIPLVDLLNMRGTVPGDWHKLPLTLDTGLWLSVTRLGGELALICGSGLSSPRRQAQRAATHELQGALGHVIRATLLRPAASDPDARRATDRADAKFTTAAHAVGHELATIRAEASALRAPRQ